MTHFNHEWDTTQTPAIPESVGDRFYAQDLNDDFNYLKHLPYEIFLQGRSRGVLIPPKDTWTNSTNTLKLQGGMGVMALDNTVTDYEEPFVVPPPTTTDKRYERVLFVDTILVLPNDGGVHYIVATPTKRSYMQRAKSVLTGQYYSRIKYESTFSIQDTAPASNQILVGLCHNKEYLLLADYNPDQCKDVIFSHKWFGQTKISTALKNALIDYYNTTTTAIKTKIIIETVDNGIGITTGNFSNCDIVINTISDTDSKGINSGIFNNCKIYIGTLSGNTANSGINGGIFNNCKIEAVTVSNVSFVNGGTFNNCIINISGISNGKGFGGMGGISNCNNCIINISGISNYGIGIINSIFNNCKIGIDTVGSNGAVVKGDTYNGYGVFNNCDIDVNTIDSGSGVANGTFNNCAINITTVSSGSGVANTADVELYLTRIDCSAITNLSNTVGKLNVLNNTVLHAS